MLVVGLEAVLELLGKQSKSLPWRPAIHVCRLEISPD